MIICTKVKYGETFYGRLTALNTNCSEIYINLKDEFTSNIKSANSVWRALLGQK